MLQYWLALLFVVIDQNTSDGHLACTPKTTLPTFKVCRDVILHHIVGFVVVERCNKEVSKSKVYDSIHVEWTKPIHFEYIDDGCMYYVLIEGSGENLGDGR